MTSPASSTGFQASEGHPDISWPLERPMQGRRPPPPTRSDTPSSTRSDTSTITLDPAHYPDGKMSLSGISLRAFLLGTTLGVSIILTLFPNLGPHTPWRVPFFIASLSLFHFLEYFITARYNTQYATLSAFLLSSNGWAYNAAHGSAVVECLLAHLIWGCSTSGLLFSTITEPVSSTSLSLLVILGLLLMILGQTVRSLAMVHAASNFNHHVQVEHKEGHVLVQTGVYRYLRHPSYFGFFWWGLGTQLVLGNVVCFVGYAVVLWRFFSDRIRREEKLLVQFFGTDYVQYRQVTPVAIPGIR